MPFALTVARRRGWASLPLRISLAALLLIPLLPGPIARGAGQPPAHLVVSEIVTGGASASDELIEIHNPTSAPLPLEGLEVVYASASGATVSRRAAWELGAPSVPAGGHVLIANQDGLGEKDIPCRISSLEEARQLRKWLAEARTANDSDFAALHVIERALIDFGL